MELTAPPVMDELPRPFIAACVISIIAHAGVAGWYHLKAYTGAVELPHPTLHVKVQAMHERASIAPAIEPVRTVIQPAPLRHEAPLITTSSPSLFKADSRSAEVPENLPTPIKNEPMESTAETPPPIQVSEAATDNGPTYSPPSSNSTSLNNPKPDYPRIALRRGIEGVVLLHVDVDEQGRPVEVHVKKSAGFKPLDIAALKAVHHWRFLPAQRNGTNVRASVEVPIRFRLDKTGRRDLAAEFGQ